MFRNVNLPTWLRKPVQMEDGGGRRAGPWASQHDEAGQRGKVRLVLPGEAESCVWLIFMFNLAFFF